MQEEKLNQVPKKIFSSVANLHEPEVQSSEPEAYRDLHELGRRNRLRATDCSQQRG